MRAKSGSSPHQVSVDPPKEAAGAYPLLGVLDFADLYSELTKYGEVTAWEKLSA